MITIAFLRILLEAFGLALKLAVFWFFSMVFRIVFLLLAFFLFVIMPIYLLGGVL